MSAVAPAGAAYRDAGRPVGDRVADLLARMTLEEKVAQLGSAWVFQLADGPDLDAERAADLLGHGLGQVTRISGASSLDARQAAGLANAIQRRLVEGTRLGIPAVVHEEICSGVMSRGSLIFPQALGVAATWDPGHAAAIGDAVRRQMRSMGAHQGLSPVLDVCRDPRWGRTEETFGEDPYMVARMGVAFVQGLQGDDLTEGVIATAKHFVGYGASEGGLNWAPPHIGPRELREVYLHPFEAVVRSAGVRSVMHAYNELDGIPLAAHHELLTGVLRDEWGFEGCVVADYFAVRQLAEYHHVAADAEEAAVMALDAGIDVELPGTDCFGDPLLRAARRGRVSAGRIDAAVARVLRDKFELGLFEEPYVDADRAVAAVATPAHRHLARTVARQSLVLLRNDGTLPLSGGAARIAVIGPNADSARHLLGDYTYPSHVESLVEIQRTGDNVFSMPLDDSHVLDAPDLPGTTVLAALRARFGADRVGYAQGCGVTGPATADPLAGATTSPDTADPPAGPTADPDTADPPAGPATGPGSADRHLGAATGPRNADPLAGATTSPDTADVPGAATGPATADPLAGAAGGTDTADVPVAAGDPCPDRRGFDEAVALAASADVAVLVMGEKAGLTDDCTTGESRDVASLDLPGLQEDLARAVLATGTPVVLVLVAGRPIGSAALHEACAAVVMAWLPGEQGGEAIAEVLAGDAAPGGKLPISYPRSVGQVPVFYGHKVSGGRSHWKGDYVDAPVAPLHPFGHGLSYTTFALSDVVTGPGEVSWHDAITTTLTVTNTGERAGDEVVQLYVRDPVASTTRPVLELASFARVGLAPGEARTVTFTTPVGQLGFHDRRLAYVVEAGRLDVFVGTSSAAADLVAAGSVTVVADPTGRPPRKQFDGTVTIT